MKNVKLNGMKYAVKFLFKKVYGRKIKKYDLVFITNKSKEKNKGKKNKTKQNKAKIKANKQKPNRLRAKFILLILN